MNSIGYSKTEASLFSSAEGKTIIKFDEIPGNDDYDGKREWAQVCDGKYLA